MAKVSTCVLVVLLAVGGVACGGDDDRLTKTQFVSAADKVCKDGNAALDNAFAHTFPADQGAPNPQVVKDFLKTIVFPSIGDQFDKIDKLKPPEDIDDAVAKMLADGRARITALLAQLETDPDGVIAQAETAFADVNEQATDIGLKECGES